MEWMTWAMAAVTSVVMPSSGYVIRQGLGVAKRLTAVEGAMQTHEEVDAQQFKNIAEHLTLIREQQTFMRNEQKDQTNKLDRLVERFLQPNDPHTR